jgi:protein TonB
MGLVITLGFSILFFQVFKRIHVKSLQRSVSLNTLEVEEIPETQQERKAPPPARPTVPIASEDEDLPEDETIDETIINFDDQPPPPPPPPDDDAIVFVPYDEPPQPIGGFAAIQRKLVYPEIARKAGVEGRVLVYAQIDEDGTVQRTKVVKSLGPNGCDEAAVNAIRSVRWLPAKQRDRAVKVWIAVPVDFKLQ